MGADSLSVRTKASTATRIVRREPSRPLQRSADICVVGSGIAGVSAAIEAARLGKKVLLIDGLPVLGGQAVNSIVGTICGMFSNGRDGYQLTYGIAEDIIRDLSRTGAVHYRQGVTNIIIYDEVALGRWIENAIRDAGIDVLLGAVLREVEVRDRRVRALGLATRYGDVRVEANGFVDASGDAALVWQAGFPCQEAADGPVFGTQMVVLEGIDEAHVPSREELPARMRERAASYGLVRREGLSFIIPGRGIAAMNMTHMETPLDPFEMSNKTLEGRDQADRAVQFLRSEFPKAFGKARVRAYGFPGIRQTRWIRGRQQLTAEDVITGREFDDAIARTAWPIELHDSGTDHVWRPFGEDHMHYVPFGSLTPRDADNVVAAGRCIDADNAALSSVRVMGPCIAMGAAAAHALDLAGTGSVHQIDMAALRQRLRDNLERKVSGHDVARGIRRFAEASA
ncbi:FAD-dependent oxidoreductase [Bradyrhizobium liaoningense]|uniref:FAD-dependent oxidoreductase n=1 Tax=Bradyrhizobium liaoningense TaxID=43992 RepID=UPI001BABB019|nr:FAD-dependent oxidoreductase [Bradyrhizobium liaoningense]MBR0713569.1 FAD-dependent oxidoreductase [Bradyrhizobium liaoningense]